MVANSVSAAERSASEAEHESKPGFLSDIETIRRRARQQVMNGAVTPSYGANREQVIKLLNASLATEIICVLRYRRHYFMADGAVGEAIKGELLKHANEEQAHADLVAERVAVESYTEMIRFLGDSDPTTRRMLEGILAAEEQHAEELASMLKDRFGKAHN